MSDPTTNPNDPTVNPTQQIMLPWGYSIVQSRDKLSSYLTISDYDREFIASYVRYVCEKTGRSLESITPGVGDLSEYLKYTGDKALCEWFFDKFHRALFVRNNSGVLELIESEETILEFGAIICHHFSNPEKQAYIEHLLGVEPLHDIVP